MSTIAEEDETLSLRVPQSLVLDLAYDSCGLFAVTRRVRWCWRVVEIERRDLRESP